MEGVASSKGSLNYFLHQAPCSKPNPVSKNKQQPPPLPKQTKYENFRAGEVAWWLKVHTLATKRAQMQILALMVDGSRSSVTPAPDIQNLLLASVNTCTSMCTHTLT